MGLSPPFCRKNLKIASPGATPLSALTAHFLLYITESIAYNVLKRLLERKHMQRARFWILCAMGALLVISGAMLVGARHWMESAKALKNVLPHDVDMRLSNLILSEAGEEGRSMVVNAASARYYKARDLFELEKIQAKIITDKGDYRVEAERGQYAQSEKNITLNGSISLFDNQAGVLVTESLRFNFSEGKLIGDEAFCYATPTLDLEGRSFVFHVKDKRLEVAGRSHILLN